MDSTNEQPMGADPGTQLLNFSPDPSPTQQAPIAPMWHTVLLILAIVSVSWLGFVRHNGPHGAVVAGRLETYATTAILELVLIGWVAFGLKLRGIQLRSLFGKVSISLKAVVVDFGIAIVFWILSMMALATVAMMWISIESWITHKPIPVQTDKNGRPTMANPADDRAAKAVVQLAPENAREIAAWLMLCMLVGVAEELVFRGYLQTQFTAWAKGAAAAGVVFSAIVFGAAHGYEGARAMFMLTIFGAFFSLLALFRRNLRAGIFAHSWHDAFAGLAVALLHARHVL
ncbi:CPBP family intramembrane glutamic endopeptidase [Occallatibacter savannae]|uniref:CPBP family intramembrane glutamic endopeptidase n=1 Tax=Occallatibacter savannae TaxID=1002691 RepID=UPI000D697EA7|nr:CPBP family intramembrane glutamic endopeptidase [Occallatibacter savannae]